MAQTPYTRLTTSGLNTLASSTLGSLKVVQLKQVMELLDRLNVADVGLSDVTNSPTITSIVAKLGTNNP